MEIHIRNKHTYKGKGVYVGRPSILSNPFRITKTQSRPIAVDRYAIWLKDVIKNKDPKVLYELEYLSSPFMRNEDLTLICWCSPKLCHAEIIKQVLLNKYHNGLWLIDGEIGVREL